MVVRPPIETWTRMQLEENFHSIYQQLQVAQKKVNEQEKKITVLNTRLRSSVMERKAKDDAFVDREKFEEVQRENQVLALKLKTAKHQILTYTTPAARTTTASAMTGRTTYRPQPSIRKPPQTASTSADKTNRTEPNTERARTPTSRISETSLKDKAAYIRLNRLVKEKNSELAELNYEIERLNGTITDLRGQLEQKSAAVRDLENELRNTRGQSDNAQYLGKIELITKQLDVMQAENEVLKEANERLVKQSLSMEFDESTKEQVELRKQIALLEERIKDSEQRRQRVEQRLRDERRKQKRIPKISEVQPEKSLTRSQESLDEIEVPSRKEESAKKRSKKNKNDDDILERLYRDVSAILSSHDDRLVQTDSESSTATAENLSKWKKMYAALYDELEKVRNLLLIQNNINQKQNMEVKLLQEELDAMQVRCEVKLKEMRDKVVEKQKKVLLLEEQIRSIAYGSQKPIPLRVEETKEQMSTELSIMFTSISLSDEFVGSVGVCPAYFLSLEFFDFELQTTPILTKQKTALDYTTIYSVVVSNLFVHYIETNGITIEMYSPQNTSYALLAAGVVNLKPLLQKGAKSRLLGELKLISLDSGATIATLTYELNCTQQLEKAIANFQTAEAAQKVLPIEIPYENEQFEELTVMVHRCTNLDKFNKGEMEVCVIYEFFSFSPYFTNYVTSSKTAEFNSKRDWSLPSESIQSYLMETEIAFFLFENRTHSNEEKDGVLAMLSLPLAPLRDNKIIKGSFEMVKADGSDCGVLLDVTIMWKHGIKQTLKPLEPTKTPPETVPSKPVPAFPPQVSIDVIRSGSSSSEENYSPISVVSPMIPSVAESTERDAVVPVPKDIETVSLKRTSSRSSAESGDGEDKASIEEKQPSPSSSSRSSESAAESVHSQRSTNESNLASSIENELTNPKEDAPSSQSSSSQEKEKAKDEIRSLLGNLPPIAKPRLSKTPSSYSDFSLFADRAKEDGEGGSATTKEGNKNGKDEKHRSVVFTEPLHHSIPPSETSSASSPPPKPAVRLPAAGKRSAIRVQKQQQIEEDGSDTDESRTVSIFIDRIYIPEFSRLLHPSYDGVSVYVDWFFLDYPLEESRTPMAIPLPRIPDSPGLFVYKKEFQLSRRRVALLEQWLELGNRLDFTLITEGEDSEELAVAQLELGRTATDETTTIQFLDVNGEHYADLDLVVSYSPQIFDCLKKR
ncbi:hypothetical protein Q1695_010994 [Nippostrongylus brasiliensis]|nr:hypothetical protein Q1695_010994 [Nippostrongylus brasiliensis]